MTTIDFVNTCKNAQMCIEMAQQKYAPSTRYELFALARNELDKLLDSCVQEMRVDNED